MNIKLLIGLIILLIILIGLHNYFSPQTVECWWSVLYPPLTPIENEENEMTQISSKDNKYFYSNGKEIEVEKEKPIEYKFAFWEWLKSIFK